MSASPPPSIIANPSSVSSTTVVPTTAPAAVSSSHGGPTTALAQLTNPLSVKVTGLRKPEVYSSARADVELSEEGDILHSVLGGVPPSQQHLTHPPSAVCPVLTFSNSRGVHLVGEFFRALLSFRNNAIGYLSRLFVRVELVSPQNQRSVLWDKEIPRMEGKSNREVRVEHRLLEPGKYTLSAHVAFSDMGNESKRLAWSSNFEVARGIVEIQRKVTLVPPQPATFSQLQGALPSTPKGASGAHLSSMLQTQQGLASRVCVSTVLQNSLPDASLMLTNVRFVVRDGSTLQLMAQPQALRGGGTVPTQFSHQYCGGGRDALEEAHIAPGDTRHFMFELVPSPGRPAGGGGPSQTASPPPSLSSPMTFFSSGASGVTLSKSVELGHIEWEWRRTSGDGGVDMSSILRLNRSQHSSAKQPDVDLHCIGVTTSVPASDPADAGVTHQEGERILAGRVCALQLVAVNRSATRRDIALHVHPMKLLPHIAYSGPTVKPLGFVEPHAELCFLLPIAPMVSGLWPLVGFAELRDARNPNVVIWPAKMATSQGGAPPSLVQSAAQLGGNQSMPAAAALSLPQDPWPPKLCDLLVL